MAEKSYFEVLCPCGAVNKPHERLSRCIECGRTLELRWPASHAPATIKKGAAAHAENQRDAR